VEIELELPEPLGFLFEPHRYKVAWGGRGSAKSWSFARALLVIGATKPLRILCAREIQRSLRESVHQLLKDQIKELNLGAHYRVLDTEIRGAKTDTLFMYAGLQAHTAMSIKSYEGVDIVWVEEGQSVPKRSWDILLPTIRKPGSEIWVSMNPELATDEPYQRFIANPPPNARVVQMNYADNPWFTAENEAQRLHAEQNSDPEDYRNIWLGQPRTSVSGSIFGRQMSIMRKLGRIGKVPPRRQLALNAFLDLGSSVGNATAVWLHQQYGAAHHFVKYWDATGQGLRYFWNLMDAWRRENELRWGTIYLPHDGRANLQGAELINRVEIMESLAAEAKVGVEVVAVPRVTDLGAAIDVTREKMTDAYIDETECADGIRALDHYKYEWIEAEQRYSRQPAHTWASNGVDAFRQWATGYSPSGVPEGERRGYESRGGSLIRGAY
jgi:phage terminase large subunit